MRRRAPLGCHTPKIFADQMSTKTMTIKRNTNTKRRKPGLPPRGTNADTPPVMPAMILMPTTGTGLVAEVILA